VDLLWLLRLSHDEYVEAFRGTAIKRAKVWMLRRNAAVALGNVGDASCLPALDAALREDDHPLVRGHAAWALGRLVARVPAPEARGRLNAALRVEQDESVREELQAAIGDVDSAETGVYQGGH
jgi:epoxyqueuosine reductase